MGAVAYPPSVEFIISRHFSGRRCGVASLSFGESETLKAKGVGREGREMSEAAGLAREIELIL